MKIPDSMVNFLMVTMTVVAIGAVAYRVTEVQKHSPVPIISEIREWRSYGSRGSAIGSPNADVQIVVFSDFQCPYCREFADSARAVIARYPTRVRMVFRHHPIDDIHPHATAAARASICADRMGRFEQMHNAMFDVQDSIGVLPWTYFAERAGIEDTAVFVSCLSSDLPDATLRHDRADADRLAVSGTPVVLINETRVLGMPPRRVLDSLVSLKMGHR